MAQEVTMARELYYTSAVNAERQSFRTVGGATEKGYSPLLKRAILSYEHQQRQEEKEAMAFYDDDGNQLNRKKGQKDHVNIYPKDVPRENLIMTHNHPGALGQKSYRSIGFSLSPDDMDVAVTYNAKEMRAVTPRYTYSFKRPQGGWNATPRQVRAAFKKALAQVHEEGKYYYDRAKRTDVANERYVATYYHKVNKLIAKQFGWNYTKKRG